MGTFETKYFLYDWNRTTFNVKKMIFFLTYTSSLFLQDWPGYTSLARPISSAAYCCCLWVRAGHAARREAPKEVSPGWTGNKARPRCLRVACGWALATNALLESHPAWWVFSGLRWRVLAPSGKDRRSRRAAAAACPWSADRRSGPGAVRASAADCVSGGKRGREAGSEGFGVTRMSDLRMLGRRDRGWNERESWRCAGDGSRSGWGRRVPQEARLASECGPWTPNRRKASQTRFLLSSFRRHHRDRSRDCETDTPLHLEMWKVFISKFCALKQLTDKSKLIKKFARKRFWRRNYLRFTPITS